MSYERYYSFFNSITVKRLYSLGYFGCLQSATPSEKLKATDFTLLYSDGGDFYVKTGENSCALKKGNAIFIKKSDAFSLAFPNANAKIFFAVFGADEALTSVPSGVPIKTSVFGKALLSRITAAAKSIYGEKSVASEVDLKTLLKYLSSSLALSENSDTENGQIVKNCLELLVLDYIKPAYKSINSDLNEKTHMLESEKLAEKITAIITRDFKENITLKDVSEKLFFSTTYLKRVYKRHTGKGILQARTEFKILRAKQLLADGEKIADVASALGFSSVNHFSVAFKKFTKTTPGEYKKSLHPL